MYSIKDYNPEDFSCRNKANKQTMVKNQKSL